MASWLSFIFEKIPERLFYEKHSLTKSMHGPWCCKLCNEYNDANTIPNGNGGSSSSLCLNQGF